MTDKQAQDLINVINNLANQIEALNTNVENLSGHISAKQS